MFVCCRELVIKERLIEFHKGTLLLPDGRTSSDILPFVGGYIGAFFSAISVAMYEVRRFSMLLQSAVSCQEGLYCCCNIWYVVDKISTVVTIYALYCSRIFIVVTIFSILQKRFLLLL